MRHTAPSMKLDHLRVQAQSLCAEGIREMTEGFDEEVTEDVDQLEIVRLLAQKAGFMPAAITMFAIRNSRQLARHQRIIALFGRLMELYRVFTPESEEPVG